MRHIALLVESSHGCGRSVLQGIARYNSVKRDWSILYQPHGKKDQRGEWLEDWRGDGILAQIRSRPIADIITKMKIPVVDLCGDQPEVGLPFVSGDPWDAARMVLEHFWERGLRHFAFCGFRAGFDSPADARGTEFAQLVKDAGNHFGELRLAATVRHAPGWEKVRQRIARWLKTQPKPLAVLAGSDEVGLHVIDTCHRVGIAVPDEVAVTGCGNDEYVCNLTNPGQSSVDLAGDQIGYEAAALLDRIISGKRAPTKPKLVRPRGVVARGSTDTVATEQEDVIAAVRFIRDHACRPLTVSEVLEDVCLSRSTLEPRMKEIVGRTIHQEIRHVQIQRAKDLLAHSDWPIRRIATECGFRTVQYLTRVFGKAVGETPMQYRRSTRI